LIASKLNPSGLQKGRGHGSADALLDSLRVLASGDAAGIHRVTKAHVGDMNMKNLTASKLARALGLTKATPKPGHVKLSATPKEGKGMVMGGAPPPPPPPRSYQMGESTHPSDSVSAFRRTLGSSGIRGPQGVGVANVQSVPSVGWSMSAGGMGPGGHDSITLEGTDYLFPISSTLAGGAAGSVISSYRVNPRTLNLPRLSAMATLFERYYFEHFEVIYVSACASSINGGMVMYFERDPEDVLPTSNDARLTAAFGHQGVIATNWWTGTTCVLPPNPGDYFIDAGTESRLSNQAIFRALVEINGTPGVQPGLFMVRYKCRLWQSKIDGSIANSALFMASGVSGFTAAVPFGTGALTEASNSVGGFVTYASTGIFTMASGYPAFLVTVRVIGTVMSAFVTTLTNLSATPLPASACVPASYSAFNSTATSGTYYAYYSVTDPTLVSTYAIALTATTVTAAEVMITPIRVGTFPTLMKQLSRRVDQAERELRLARKEIQSSLLEMKASGDDPSGESEVQTIVSPSSPSSRRSSIEYIDSRGLMIPMVERSDSKHHGSSSRTSSRKGNGK